MLLAALLSVLGLPWAGLCPGAPCKLPFLLREKAAALFGSFVQTGPLYSVTHTRCMHEKGR